MGPDNIQVFLIRDCAAVFDGPLTLIFNLIVKTSRFPSTWKLLNITPVFKKGDQHVITNYRPIILILVKFSKLYCMILSPAMYQI